MKGKEKLIIGDFIDGSAIVYKKEKMNLVKGVMFENGFIWIQSKMFTFFYSNRYKTATLLSAGISQLSAKKLLDFIGTTALGQTKRKMVRFFL